jgi:hypothetical protein
MPASIKIFWTWLNISAALFFTGLGLFDRLKNMFIFFLQISDQYFKNYLATKAKNAI